MVWLRRLLVVEAAVLAVTGVLLLWLYRPESGLQATHLVASTAFSWTVLVYLVVIVARRASRSRWPWSLGLLAFAAFASFTGFLLPWDQLALRAVTVGTNIRGVWHVFSDEVAFVLVGGAEISTATYGRWLVVHALLLPLVAAAGLWAVRRRVGSGTHAADAGEPDLRRGDALARHGDPQPHA